MKRRKYLVTSSNGYRVVRFAWNAALKVMKHVVQEEANKNGGEWFQATQNVQTDALKRHTRGEFAWQRVGSDQTLTFTIKLMED